MTRDQIYAQIVSIISELFEIPPEDIRLDSNLYTELDLDSIDAVDLVVQLRKVLKRDIEPSVFKQVRTVNDVVDVIENILKD
ncbi:acyl carrier protein [Wohlfahrtiimonas chitiniclastica]|uniref:Acyl carrier protein 2 n=2 Tax=Wohlfahrtiimonas chitiniclastica TaxID=400946 RepID=L8XYZ7_9GAMM|nr:MULTISPECIES: acyl carrier protein [Wohlfahrtiimonas]ELV08039.1 Acyl carrier protein 2 [Wohlfahrtiimonas chitiniclastica SH04]KZS23779.1 acyl carrier protein [Wohlfahrtiimonas chitiniclastica]KZX36556.1 acyl carrier protein [Wohlfahrtiimonas chitiniclastica]MBS7818408.1 acyl carrier protein [Wohlfahrtiimonas chitiniclastica]MBS7820326.1 acyl carrier protein [Wohlfahrtiimonas chitiniclastica]